MPGIADLVPAQIQASSVGAVTNPNVDVGQNMGTLPEFKDFMDAYKQGIITADDIRKRGIVGTTGMEAERAKNIADKAQSEQLALDVSEVRPAQRELVKTQTQVAQQAATLASELNSPDPAIRIPAQEAFHKREDQLQTIQAYGTLTPKIEVPADVKPEPYNDWVFRQIKNMAPEDQSQEMAIKRAQEQERLLKLQPKDNPEYQVAVEAAKSRTRVLDPGTPEYEAELAKRVDAAVDLKKQREIRMRVFEEFSKARATAEGKAIGEGPAKVNEAQNAAAKDLRTNFNSVKGVDSFQKVNSAYQQIQALTEPGREGNPIEDQQIMFAWMKALDPTSAVRETEYANVQNARGVPDAIRSVWNSWVDKRLLTETQREQLRNASNVAIQAHVPPEIKQYIDLEDKAGLAPGTVVPVDYRSLVTKKFGSTAAPAQAQAPRPSQSDKDMAPKVKSVEEVLKLSPRIKFFLDPDGQMRVNPNFKPI